MSDAVAKQCRHLRNAAFSALYPPKYWLARLSPGTVTTVPLKTYSLPSIVMLIPSYQNKYFLKMMVVISITISKVLISSIIGSNM